MCVVVDFVVRERGMSYELEWTMGLFNHREAWTGFDTNNLY